MTLNINFFTAEEELKSRVLSTIPIDGNHSGENIRNFINEQLKSLNLDVSKMNYCAAVTDGGDNMINAAKMLKTPHYPCFGHLLNNAIKPAMDFPEVDSLIAKCKEIIRYFHIAPKLNKNLKNIRSKMSLPVTTRKNYVVTRWNSKFIMLESLSNNKTANHSLAGDREFKKIKDINLTAEECTHIQFLLNILRPFYEITKFITTSKITISIIMPFLHKYTEEMLYLTNYPEYLKNFK